MSPEDRTRLLHMVEAADAAAAFMNGRTRVDLDTDQMLLLPLLAAVRAALDAR